MKTTLKPLLAALCLSAFACTVSAQTIKAADVHPEGYPNVVAVQHMGEKLKQQTDGKLEIKVFPGGVLGDEKQMIEQAQMGAIDMIRVSMAPVAAILPDIEVFTLPYVFRDEDHMHKVIDGDIGKQIGDKLTANPKSRLVFLGWMDSGTRNQPGGAGYAESDGGELGGDGRQRGLQRHADRGDRRRGEQPANLYRPQLYAGRQKLHAERPLHHPGNAALFQSEMGQAQR